MNVTPFNSANGIFIDWIFSSGVIGPPVFLQLVIRGLDPRIHLSKLCFEMMDCRVPATQGFAGRALAKPAKL
jgi:hypothetical protein